MLIDTHAHLNFTAFNEDRDKVIKRSLDNNVWMINIGTNFQTSKKAVEVAKKYKEGIFASVGLHPINLETGLLKRKIDTLEGEGFEDYFDYEKYKKMAQSQKVVAIGEVGLDYYWKPKTTKKKELFKEKQKELLLQEVQLAEELGLPIIFHCRVAHQDLIKFLIEHQGFNNAKLKGVMHGFVGTKEQLQKYLDFGFSIGFNGIIFKKIEGVNFLENIKNTPLERILIETDCPYLAPPQLGEKRNEPVYVKNVVQKIAKIKKVSFERIEKISTDNARQIFSI